MYSTLKSCTLLNAMKNLDIEKNTRGSNFRYVFVKTFFPTSRYPQNSDLWRLGKMKKISKLESKIKANNISSF